MEKSVNNTQLDPNLDVDTLYNNVYQPQEEQEPQEVIPETKEPIVEKEPEYEINWKGETKKLPISKIKNYAQQAYDYNEKMREYNINKELLQKEREEFSNKSKEYDVYKKIDEYTKQNPDWWSYVQDSWGKLSGPQNSGVNEPNNELVQKVNELYSKFKNKEERERIESQVKQDEALEKEIGGYKEKYTYFDWKSKDEEGLDLEKRILKHAIDNNISKFSAAANDFLHEEFLKRSKFEGKEDHTNKVRIKNKLGLGEVETKTKTIKSYDKTKSYDDLAREALEELNIS